MEITINNTLKIFEGYDSLSVQQLLNLEIPERQKGIALAINNTVIPRSEWQHHRIQRQDKIIIIKATQGG
ncbi:sulfur carrier protein ThiS [Pseudochryseolinea flava]|uniref:Thiamine biosynthesis protein ThiS n=1 Tax=Pseudochryseolinea flava TaxID=2059302 RepID=A0A364XX90_9BACT|nr:sulfur carrier protein ThiS [Pseudochryseolinea flava]RAV99016.1 thiamine biosynthesis protein ThiS [Pseudochryseolinea flava]